MNTRRWLIIDRMIINLNEAQIRTLSEVRAVLDGTRALQFSPAESVGERYAWIAAVLKRLRYAQLKRAERGLVLRYLQRFGGFSRAQLTRLVQRWLARHPLVLARSRPPNAFARRYTESDLDALAEVEREYGRLSGPATVVVLRRMFELYGDARFVRLRHLSSSHLYNLRRSAGYRARHTVRTKTRSDPRESTIAVRRAPLPEQRAGFIRIDSVHQGNLDGQRGLYHINAVDCVTQWQVVASVPTLTREHMLPVLAAMLAQFPFKVLGFHSDGGMEYVNHQVAELLESERIEFTRSRPRHCNDNALVEAKNGVVVRRQFGYQHVPESWAAKFSAFCREHLNPFLNLHRPCMFGTEVPDSKKPGRTRRVHRKADVMTPLDKLVSLPDAQGFLRDGLTLETLQAQARSLTDVQAARKVRVAREALLAKVTSEVRNELWNAWRTPLHTTKG